MELVGTPEGMGVNWNCAITALTSGASIRTTFSEAHCSLDMTFLIPFYRFQLSSKSVMGFF